MMSERGGAGAWAHAASHVRPAAVAAAGPWPAPSADSTATQACRGSGGMCG